MGCLVWGFLGAMLLYCTYTGFGTYAGFVYAWIDLALMRLSMVRYICFIYQELCSSIAYCMMSHVFISIDVNLLGSLQHSRLKVNPSHLVKAALALSHNGGATYDASCIDDNGACAGGHTSIHTTITCMYNRRIINSFSFV